MPDMKIKYSGGENVDVKSRLESVKPVPLTDVRANQVSYVEVLDKYDDMEMRIDVNSFEKTFSTGDYGIEYNEDIHTTGRVILDEQYEAAKYFMKNLRGFGVLADTVGSGKTYEAGLVLSELAAAGKIETILIIAPNKDLLKKWKKTLELEFGMGKDTIVEKETEFKNIRAEFEEERLGNTYLLKPKQPIIVTKENFVKWDLNLVKSLLFDVVVVDEAHYLNDEEGDGAIALRNLSYLMRNKQLKNKNYCILLTATPHSGNLAKMFNLWYFVAEKGGVPSDFDGTNVVKSEKYKRRKEKFVNACRGAETVSEFLATTKEQMFEANDEILEAFYAYLRERGIADYNEASKWDKRKYQNEFLSLEKNQEINRELLKNVSRAYYDNVLGVIMRRNTQNEKSTIRAKKVVTNIYICPTTEKTLERRQAELKASSKNGIIADLNDIYGDEALTVNKGNKTYKTSLEEYYKENPNNSKAEIMLTKVLTKQLLEMGVGSPFEHAESLKYYWSQLERTERDPNTAETNNQFRIMTNYDSENEDATIHFKLKELKKIFLDNPDDKIIVFFDYERKNNKTKNAEWFKVYDELSKDEAFKDRLILALNGTDAVDRYNKIDNAIFLSGSERYTEGVDMQSGHIVVNFSVTCDPLAMSQRVGRAYRLGQKNNVQIISLAMMNELEGYALAYQTRIGLLSTNEGDATIIAGSNSEKMIALECRVCHKTKLMSKKEYDEKYKSGDSSLYCTKPECVKQIGATAKGMPLSIINSQEYKCSACGEKLRKSTQGDSGYYCISVNNSFKGKMFNIDTGESGYKTVIGCSKLCVIKHCKKIASFGKNGNQGVPCAIIEGNITNANEGRVACVRCANYKNGLCAPECTMKEKDKFDACGQCTYADCSPRPHKIYFDENSVAECPSCGRGKLRPVTANTFASYIRQSFEHNKGDANESTFCETLLQETNGVEEIKRILENN